MANTDEQLIRRSAPAGGLDMTDVVTFLRGRFGDQYPESYEHGKRELRNALRDQFGLSEGDATDLVDDMERAQTIRFRDKRGGSDSAGPRLGLFDEPRSPAGGEPEPEFAGHYWEIGRDAPVQGAW
jgi:hypothetical protein